MDDLIDEFLTETNEGLEELDVDLVNLEQNPNDKELLSKIFRLMHTIKGTCGFLGLPRLEKVAHHAENVLGRFRDGDLEVKPDYVTLIFDSIDRIKDIVRGIEETGAEPQGDDVPLIAKLDAVYEGKDELAEAAQAEPESVEQSEPEEESVVGMASMDELEAAFAAAEPLSVDELKAQMEADGIAPVEDSNTDTPAETEAAPEAAPDIASPATGGGPVATTQTLRVNVDVLEELMTMVSELVLTRNQLLQILRAQKDSDFSPPLMRLNQIVSELQEGVMKTRMQPIGNAWSKLPRIIRDLSMELGKKIDLVMEGKETELYRQVLELIKDPLTHMVRNSADHGIEMPEDRKMLGKPETGKILLKAFHEGGHIIIQIIDDGQGLPLDKIKSKIVKNGLANEDELAGLTPQQIYKYIFKPGFSTAEAVTAVSGRGVGMDVVRTNIEKIGGSIDLTSEEGQGSTFTIKIPLTLAIVSALIVESGKERFAIPQLTVKELVMTSAHADHQIETINGTPVYRLRDSLLPLVYLDQMLKLVDGKTHDEEASLEDGPVDMGQKYIVVAHVGAYQFGIVVDRVFDTEEIVVKPVSQIIRDIDIFSGNTILGDGSVVMILDPNGVARMAGEIETDIGNDAEDDALAQLKADKKVSLLLFETGDGVPKAVPLSLVARLEHIRGEDIEETSDNKVVQYRGQLMPLIPFNKETDISLEKEHPVLVFTDRDNSLGLVVTDILDITEAEINIQHSNTNPSLIGSAVIDGKATDIMDVGYYLKQFNQNWFADHDVNVPYANSDKETSKKPDDQAQATVDETTDGEIEGTKKRVLLVDDSPFFRNMLSPLLSIAGYEVTSLDRATEAIKLFEDGASFDVIVSDIEMPDMDGFEFAQRIKETPNWQDTPMVALSSHATEEDMERGKEVGFNRYVAKFDRDKLLDTISETISSKEV